MTKRLLGRTAIVTGASRGLGRAIALALASEGASVAVVARSESVWNERLPGTIHETVAEIGAEGGRAIAISADLADEEDCVSVVESAHRELGRVDLLVNNAALTVTGGPRKDDGGSTTTAKAPAAKVPAAKAVRLDGPPSILDVPLKAYKRHFSVNLFAPYRLMQLVLPDMLAAEVGSIVNISTRGAFTPGSGPYRTPGRPALFAYGSSKMALHSLTQAVAQEVADRGIAANLLIPSNPIRTPGTDLLLAGQAVERWSTQESFAEAVVRVSVVRPEQLTGCILFHEDVVSNEEPARWLPDV